MKPKALILHATGTNRDLDAAQALELAGAQAEIIHLNQLRWGERRWSDYQMLVLPGGFSYADALGAGKLLAIDLRAYFAEQVTDFVQQGKAVIGICNGFQALVKAGLLPALDHPGSGRQAQQMQATLTFNACGHFECRWVTLAPRSQRCIWTRDLSELIICPVAHGEGSFVLADPQDVEHLRTADQVALIYARPDGSPAQGAYPLNPNGSQDDIAGVCNPQGNVLGLMPHPEDHIFDYQHPRWARGERGRMGLALFQNGVNYAAQI
jgi:phosphoribosylformylglycinamidine synthase subunit PurQ / glutaminase